MQTGSIAFVGAFRRSTSRGVVGYHGRCVPEVAGAWDDTSNVQTESRNFGQSRESGADRNSDMLMRFVLPVMDGDVGFRFEVRAVDVDGEASPWAQSAMSTVRAGTSRGVAAPTSVGGRIESRTTTNGR